MAKRTIKHRRKRSAVAVEYVRKAKKSAHKKHRKSKLALFEEKSPLRAKSRTHKHHKHAKYAKSKSIFASWF